MQILVKDIPAEGKDIDFEARGDRWFQEVLFDSLSDWYRKEDLGKGHIHLLRTGENVECDGEIRCDCHPACSRCLKIFRYPLAISMHCRLAPLYKSERELSRMNKEEVELVKEDLEFSYYEGGHFNLAEMIREQIILGVPLQPLCQENCKGLCPQCGKNLNEGICICQTKPAEKRRILLKALKR